jgi:hypothetical protein
MMGAAPPDGNRVPRPDPARPGRKYLRIVTVATSNEPAPPQSSGAGLIARHAFNYDSSYGFTTRRF